MNCLTYLLDQFFLSGILVYLENRLPGHNTTMKSWFC